MERQANTEKKIQQHIDELCQNMPLYLDVYRKFPFSKPGQLELHRQTILMRQRHGSVQAALKDNSFINSIRDTLVKWGMDSRGATGLLLPMPEFSSSLRKHEQKIMELEKLDIEDTNLPLQQTAQEIWSLIEGLRLSQGGNQIVTGSKALHHILPDLVPPIDRAYTRRFFGFWMQQFQYNPEVFSYIWIRFALIARKTNPQQYVTNTDWFTSKTKILDNAVIGYCKYHNLPKLS